MATEDLGQSASFPSTNRSLLNLLISGDEDEQRRAVDELCEQYRGIVARTIRRTWQFNRDEADDLTQEFFTSYVVERKLFHQIARGHWRLRTAMRYAVTRFITAKKNQVVKAVAWDDLVLPDEPAIAVMEGENNPRFDASWHTELFAEAVRRTDEHYSDPELRRYWNAYYWAILHPAMSGGEPRPHTAIAQEVGFDNIKDMSVAILRVKHRIDRELRKLVDDTCRNREERDEEFREIARSLAPQG